MPQTTRKPSKTLVARPLNSTIALTPQDEIRMALRTIAEESGRKSVDAARKSIEREIRTALKGNRADG